MNQALSFRFKFDLYILYLFFFEETRLQMLAHLSHWGASIINEFFFYFFYTLQR